MEETTQGQEAAAEITPVVTTDAGPNPFEEDSWSGSAPQEVVEEQPQTITQNQTENQQSSTAAPSNDETVVDADEYVKQNFGYNNLAEAKADIEKLRTTAQTPAEIKFANEQSQKLYEAIQGGKEEDVYSYLDQKRQLARIEKMDVDKVSDAEEILRLNMQLKHKELSKEDIDFHLKDKYNIPAKPVQSDIEMDEDYQQRVAGWENQVKQVERRMMIDAKLAKPEFAKYQSDLALPDIPQRQAAQAGPTPEQLAEAEQNKQHYLAEVSKGLSEAKGFSAKYKDEEVEIPISYEIAPEERAAIKPILESLHTDFSYFGNRWANPDGSLNSVKMAEDINLLENQGRIFQKMVNEAGTQRLAHKIKQSSNIQLEQTQQNTFTPDAAEANAKFGQEVWEIG